MTKRLLQINPVLRTNTSTGRIVQEIGELAMAHGWESYIAYSRGRDGMKPCQSQVVPVGGKADVAWHGLMTRLFDRHGLASQRATRELVERMEDLQPDIIHLHNIHGYFLHYPTLFEYLARIDTPVVWTIHDCWAYTGHCYYYSFAGCQKWRSGCGNCPQRRLFPASWWKDRSHQNILDKAAAFTAIPRERLTVVPVSHWMKGEMLQSFMGKCRFRVIHNGINLVTFMPYDDDLVRYKYHIYKDRVLLAVASIWCREKGWDDLMRMAAMLRDDEVLVMVGVTEGQRRKLPKNIVGICRTSNVDELAQLYSLANVFLNPTWQDNYPTVNLEALACGTPVVTYQTGGSVEAVTDRTGMVVEQGDVDAMLEAARTICSRGKRFYGEACREYAMKHFDKDERYADYLRLYDELLR